MSEIDAIFGTGTYGTPPGGLLNPNPIDTVYIQPGTYFPLPIPAPGAEIPVLPPSGGYIPGFTITPGVVPTPMPGSDYSLPPPTNFGGLPIKLTKPVIGAATGALSPLLFLLLAGGKINKKTLILLMVLGGGIGALGGMTNTPSPDAPAGTGALSNWLGSSVATFGSLNPLQQNPLSWFRTLGGPGWSPLS